MIFSTLAKNTNDAEPRVEKGRRMFYTVKKDAKTGRYYLVKVRDKGPVRIGFEKSI